MTIVIIVMELVRKDANRAIKEACVKRVSIFYQLFNNAEKHVNIQI